MSRRANALAIAADAGVRRRAVAPASALAIGALAGAFAGLFGVGGGAVIVPLLLLMGVGARPATAVSLLAIAVMAAAGASLQAAYGHVHVGAALLVGVPAIPGALLGTAVQQRIPVRAISLAFAGLLAVVGVLTVADVQAHGGASSVTAADAVALGSIGAAAGALSGLLGVGGGALFVPGLSLVLGLDQVDAEATSLLAIVLAALVGALNQRRYGNLDARLGAFVALGSIPGAAVGVVIVNLLPVRLIQVLFGLLLLLIATRMATRGLAARGALTDVVDNAGDSAQPSAPGSSSDN